MNITFHLPSAVEITTEFLDSVNAHFKSKAMTITVEEDVDTTAYLNSNIENKKMLQKSLEEAKNGAFVEVNVEDF